MGARALLSELAGAGVSVTADGESLLIRPASKLTDTMRAALREAKPDLLKLLRELSAMAWTDADIARFETRRARLLRWGWAEPDAEALAERLVIRDRERDDRVSCTDCQHYRPNHCGNHRRAGLSTSEIARDLAALMQRCPGFKPEVTT